jgi:hypothetical protein
LGKVAHSVNFELIDNWVIAAESTFPGIKFVDVAEGPKPSDDSWINLKKMKDSELCR